MSQDLTSSALRYNQGKPQYSLLDMKALEPLVRVLEFGAKKYARHNWKKAMNMDQLMDSMLRHVAALQNDPYDTESGIHHIGHILANAMFYSYHLQRSGVPLQISLTSPEDSSAKKSTSPLPQDGASKYGREWHSESPGSPISTDCGVAYMEDRLSPTIMEGEPSNTQNVPEKSGGNFTTRPLHSPESEKSSIT